MLQLAAHLVKLSVDLVTADTASVWSQLWGWDIKVREKLLGIYRTQPEMLYLKKHYEDRQRKPVISKTASLQGGLIGMSNDSSSNKTDCFSLSLSKVPLPYVIFCISSNVTTSNNKIFKGLLDKGSQCSILTECTVAESGLSAQVKKCAADITLCGATGSQKHPFVGELSVNVQFLCSKYSFSKPIY